jgi:hypothetical protein
LEERQPFVDHSPHPGKGCRDTVKANDCRMKGAAQAGALFAAPDALLAKTISVPSSITRLLGVEHACPPGHGPQCFAEERRSRRDCLRRCAPRVLEAGCAARGRTQDEIGSSAAGHATAEPSRSDSDSPPTSLGHTCRFNILRPRQSPSDTGIRSSLQSTRSLAVTPRDRAASERIAPVGGPGDSPVVEEVERLQKESSHMSGERFLSAKARAAQGRTPTRSAPVWGYASGHSPAAP